MFICVAGELIFLSATKGSSGPGNGNWGRRADWSQRWRTFHPGHAHAPGMLMLIMLRLMLVLQICLWGSCLCSFLRPIPMAQPMLHAYGFQADADHAETNSHFSCCRLLRRTHAHAHVHAYAPSGLPLRGDTWLGGINVTTYPNKVQKKTKNTRKTNKHTENTKRYSIIIVFCNAKLNFE